MSALKGVGSLTRMLHLALSCLQGRPMQQATEDLLSLGVKALQLTPGCAPTEGFLPWVEGLGVQVRTHHGFHPRGLRCPVWGEDNELLVTADSVHPPSSVETTHLEAWWRRIEDRPLPCLLEVMYPPLPMGNGVDIERAMDLGVVLAVDVSHLYLQKVAGVITSTTMARLMEYDGIGEIHVSANDGTRDQHRPPNRSDFGIAWARERIVDTPVVLESYLHRLGNSERLAVIEEVAA